MTRAPRISILLPARNAGDTLEQSLRSLAVQTCGDFECLIVDDASQDQTAQIAAAYVARDPRFRLLRQAEHVGIAAALNRAAAEARAPYLARQDADDRSRPQRLTRSLALLEADAKLGAVGTLVAQFPAADVPEGLRRYGEWLNGLCRPEEIAREIWVESPLAHPTVIMRRAAFEAVGGYTTEPWPEDYDLWLAMHVAGWSFAKVPEVLYDWRHHDARLTFTDPRYRPAAFLACKLHHLAPRVAGRTLIVWGAGRDGRRLVRALHARDLHPVALIDIDPRKIGRRRLGIAVHAPASLRERVRFGPDPLILVAVGTQGARALIRAQLAELGWTEMRDFLCLH